MTDDAAKQHFAQTADIEVVRAQLAPERSQRIEQVARNRQRGLALLLEDVWDPHNLAAITRTADAFGVQDIHYTTSQHFDPDQLGYKSGKRAHKWVDYTQHNDIQNCVVEFQQNGWHVIATVLSDEAPSIFEIDWTSFEQLIVAVGNERSGITNETIKQVDSLVTIPMLGMMQSLNVSVATAITLSEIIRQRQASGRSFTLAEREAEALTEDFLRRALF
jgi:tRNA (guanosine-2'-O-)-methyltransferase